MAYVRLPRRVLARTLLPALAAGATILAFASAAAAADGPPKAGVQAHLLWSGVSSQDVANELDQIKAANAKLVRVDVGWSSIEQDAKGQYSSWHLDKLDTVVDEAESRGLDLLLTLHTTPCWASSAPASVKQGCDGAWWDRNVQNYAPNNSADYADAAGYLAKRYQGRITGWEIWNEPNSDSFFKAPNPANAYARLVKAAYPAIKRADPETTVVAGSLMHSDLSFIRKLYAADPDLGDSFDAFSIHPYSDDRSPLDPDAGQPPTWSFIRGVPAVHKELRDHGDDKPLWLTEFGWNTSTTRGAASWQNGVTEAKQAQWTADSLEQVGKWSWVDAAIVYTFTDTGSDPADYLSNFGLVREDGSKKPALRTFATAARELSDGGNGDAPTDPPSGDGPTDPGGDDPVDPDDGDPSSPGDGEDDNQTDDQSGQPSSDNYRVHVRSRKHPRSPWRMRIQVRVKAAPDARAAASGRIRIGKRHFRLARTRKQLSGKRDTLRMRIAHPRRRGVKRALRHRRHASVSVVARIVPRAGHSKRLRAHRRFAAHARGR